MCLIDKERATGSQLTGTFGKSWHRSIILADIFPRDLVSGLGLVFGPTELTAIVS